ncbi:MAG: hypothetical protein F6K30_18680 [Cyanothece sp. SIO2G6]|nr:hypothetical protein [Cyanothece sp. SIO2G6]
MTKIIYKAFFNYDSLCAIDLHGTDQSLPFDLNYEISLNQKFDITINFGTGEHVFNVFQFFKTIHERVKPDGIMLHAMPFLGWVDHGFFNFQPTFYWDLAEANSYEVLAFLFILGKDFVNLDDRKTTASYLMKLQTEPQELPIFPSNIYVAMKQSGKPEEFKVPMQSFFQITPEEYWSLSKKF